ncbi:MAG: hypothetical protein J3K34DRAFT_462867 [Monoraphidium minutum]|nr:MAG: hypothetical protein J3K34DRAFT_462867 [Monoraphidium minutum]
MSLSSTSRAAAAPAAAVAAALALVLLLAAAPASACVGTSLSKHTIAVEFTGASPAKTPEASAYVRAGVEQHFREVELDEFRPVAASTFSCVDSRSSEYGTPGGDFAELAAAIAVYEVQANLTLSEADVKAIFDEFMAAAATPERPFYFHSSDLSLAKVFDAIAAAGIKPRPVVFPVQAPTDAAELQIWLDALAKGENQGCGHVKLMIERFLDYGLDSPTIPKALVMAFFLYWWPTPPGSPERAKVNFSVLQGPLSGKAVVIVDAPGCPESAPAMPAAYGGSQVFVYHAAAVEAFRERVLAPWFVAFAAARGITLDQAAFYNALKSLQAKDLAATLIYLDPANALPLWAVNRVIRAGAWHLMPAGPGRRHTLIECAGPYLQRLRVQMALRGQGKASGSEASGGRAASSGSAPARGQQGTPLKRQGDIKDFFAPRPAPKRARSAPPPPAGAGGQGGGAAPPAAAGGSGGDATCSGGGCAGTGTVPGTQGPYGVPRPPLPPSAVPPRAEAPGCGWGGGAASSSGWSDAGSPPPADAPGDGTVVAAGAAAGATGWVLEARVVGRRHQGARGLAQQAAGGGRLELRREADNPVDCNAILVVALPGSEEGGAPSAASGAAEPAAAAAAGDVGAQRAAAAGGVPVGHLPAPVACHLAPLLDGGRLCVGAVEWVAGTADTVSVSLSRLPRAQWRRPPAAAPGGDPQQPRRQWLQRRPSEGSDGGSGGSGGQWGQGAGPPWPQGAGGEAAAAEQRLEEEEGDEEGEEGLSSQAAAESVAAAVGGAAAAGAARPRSSGEVLVEGFGVMLQRIRARDGHLLDARDWALAGALAAAPPPARALCLRLLLRKRTWHRVALLAFSEVPDPSGAVQALAGAGLVRLDCDVTRAADLAALLDGLPSETLRAALVQLLPARHPAAGGGAAAAKGGKHALVAAAQGAAPPPRVAAAVRGLVGPSVQVAPALQRLFVRLQRLYFVAEGRDMSSFLAAARGGVRWPAYRLSGADVSVWPSRGALLAYEDALGHAAALEDALQARRCGFELCAFVGWAVVCVGCLTVVAAGDTARTWECLQPALAALRAGAHKEVAWDAAHAPMPNPPAGPGQGSQQQQQQGSQQGREQQCGEQQEQEQGRPQQPDAEQHTDGPSPAAAAATTTPPPAPPPPSRPLFFARFCAGWVYASLGTVAASLLERERRYGDAVELLQLLLGGNACPGRRGEWWARLSIDLEHTKQARGTGVDAALEVAEAALADTYVRHGDRLALQRRVLRLGKPPRRWRRPPWAAAVAAEPPERRVVGRPLAGSVGARNRYYGYDGRQVCVEDLALQYYARDEGGGWRGIHTEGGIWATLFGLVMWDVLFADVPGVFQSPFQPAPLDLDSDAFFPARAAAIEARLQEVALGGAGRLVSAAWEAHHGALCRGVSWSRFGLPQLLEIAECVGGVGLSVVMRLMAEDHAGSSGGLPDLLLWRTAPHPAARLVEVKGPTDRLSEQQRAWIAAIAGAGLEVEVCKVAEPP